MRRAALATALLLGATLAAPTRAEEPAKPVPAPAPETVEVTTADGMALAATYYPPQGRPAKGAPSVVALHMYRSERSAWAPIAPIVTAKGMGLLAIDMRGHGESKVQGGKDVSIAVNGRDADVFNAMHHDAWGAVRWLQRHKQVPQGKIALLGASVGCSVAIDTAVRHPSEIACVVTLTPGLAYLGVPTKTHIAEWPAGKPLLVIASEGETEQGAGPIHAALKDEGCEIVTFPGGRELHGTRMFGAVEGIETRVADWLHAKTDGVELDGKIQPYEKHGRHVEVLGERILCVIGTSGSQLYIAADPLGGKTTTETLVARILDADSDEILGTWKLNSGSSETSKGPGEGETTTVRKSWSDAERMSSMKKYAGRSVRVVVVIEGDEAAKSQAVKVTFP